MALDFRADQVRVHKIIGSGSALHNGSNQIIVYNYNVSSDGTGGINSSKFNTSYIGTDVFFYVSGSKGDGRDLAVFGGDVYHSGNVSFYGTSSFAKVAITGSLFVLSSSTFSNTVSISAPLTASNTVLISGRLTVSNTSSFTGPVLLTNSLNALSSAIFYQGISVAPLGTSMNSATASSGGTIAIGTPYQSAFGSRNKTDNGWISQVATLDVGNTTNVVTIGDVVGALTSNNALNRRIEFYTSNSVGNKTDATVRFDPISGSYFSGSLQFVSGGLMIGSGTLADPGTGNILMPNSGTIMATGSLVLSGSRAVVIKRNNLQNILIASGTFFGSASYDPGYGNIGLQNGGILQGLFGTTFYNIARTDTSGRPTFGDVGAVAYMYGTNINLVAQGAGYIQRQATTHYWYSQDGATQKMILQNGLTIGTSSVDPGAGNIMVVTGSGTNAGYLVRSASSNVPIIGMDSTGSVFIGTGSNPVFYQGGNRINRKATSNTYSVLLNDFLIAVTGTVTTTTITLPSGGLTTPGTNWVIKDESGGAALKNITIVAASGTIDGIGSAVIGTNYGSISIYSDGTNYFTL